MITTLTTFRRTLALALLALGLGSGLAHGQSRAAPFVQAGLVQVDLYDRSDAATLPVYMKDGRRYIVGAPGHEYAVRIRNRTAARVLVVTSVDGVNVISGDTAAPSQSGYVQMPTFARSTFGSEKFYRWYAPGYGLIKAEIRNRTTGALIPGYDTLLTAITVDKP